MEGKFMNCPLCKTELAIKGQSHYQDITEHVCGPNEEPSLKPKYECTNPDCMIHNYVFWDGEGSLYVRDYDNYYYNKKHYHPNLNFSALNSFDRKMSIEIYRKGLKKNTYLTLIPKRLQLRIERHYESNYMGEVLDKSYKFKVLVYSKRLNMLVDWSPWSTLKYLYSTYKRNYNRYNSYRSMQDKFYYLESLFKNCYNGEWPYRLAESMRDFIFSKEKEIYLNLKQTKLIKK